MLTISDARLEERINNVWPQVCSSPEALCFSAILKEVERLEKHYKPARPSGRQRTPLRQKQAAAIENFFLKTLKCDRPRFAEVFGLPYVDYLEAVEDGDRDVIERCFTKIPVARPGPTPMSAQEKDFRFNCSNIDAMYLRLRQERGRTEEVYDGMFGRQFKIYSQAVADKNYDLINWWWTNCPWQKREHDEFLKYFATYPGNVTSNSIEEK